MNFMLRRAGLALLSLLSIYATSSSAQSYPAKPIRFIVPLASGGGVDTSARLLGQKLTEAWGQPVVIENRPGAGGTIATEIVARAAPDGYTLVMVSSAHVITPSLYALSYDAVRDFAPITLAVLAPFVLVVHPSLPVRSVKELIALAKTRPNQLLWASSGNGSPGHLALELLKMMTGVQIVHVPYKGTAPGITDLIGGRVSVNSATIVSTMPHVTAGRLRALAVLSGKRSQAVPQLPTVAESGIAGYEIDVWYGTLAPAKTPKEIIARLHDETARILAQPDVKERMLAMGLEPIGNPPDQFADYLRAEVAKWAKVVRAADIRIN